AWHVVDGELGTPRVFSAHRGEYVEDCVADAAFRPMVFDGDDLARVAGGLAQRRRVNGLDAVEVDDPSRYADPRQRLGGGQGLVQRDPRRDQRHAVTLRRANYAAAADREAVAGAVDPRSLHTSRAIV